MPQSLVTLAYLTAGLLFIFSLNGLAAQSTARRGNILGIVGMALAVLATALGPQVANYGVLVVALGIGGLIGAALAARVAMTAMPQLVAILHSFVGAAAVLVGFASYLDPRTNLVGIEATIHEVEIFVGVFVGALTFTGSVDRVRQAARVDRITAAAVAGAPPVQPVAGRGVRDHGQRASWAPRRTRPCGRW